MPCSCVSKSVLERGPGRGTCVCPAEKLRSKFPERPGAHPAKFAEQKCAGFFFKIVEKNPAKMEKNLDMTLRNRSREKVFDLPTAAADERGGEHNLFPRFYVVACPLCPVLQVPLKFNV
jgi:hypothetical protein